MKCILPGVGHDSKFQVRHIRTIAAGDICPLYQKQLKSRFRGNLDEDPLYFKRIKSDSRFIKVINFVALKNIN